MPLAFTQEHFLVRWYGRELIIFACSDGLFRCSRVWQRTGSNKFEELKRLGELNEKKSSLQNSIVFSNENVNIFILLYNDKSFYKWFEVCNAKSQKYDVQKAQSTKFYFHSVFFILLSEITSDFIHHQSSMLLTTVVVVLPLLSGHYTPCIPFIQLPYPVQQGAWCMGSIWTKVLPCWSCLPAWCTGRIKPKYFHVGSTFLYGI